MFLTPIRAICLTMCGLSLGGLMLQASRDEQAGRSVAASPRARSDEGWTHYGGSPDQTRYSSLRQIDKSNVSRLTVAWTYDSGETGGLQTQPIVVDDVLFGYTPTHRTFALRADTGERLWIFDPKIQGRGANRGLMPWSSGDDRGISGCRSIPLRARRANGPTDSRLRGERPHRSRAGLRRDPQTQSIRLTSPGVIFKDTVIIGGRVSRDLPASPGDIRAYSIRTGKLKWAFHTIPHPGETGYETWSKDSWTIQRRREQLAGNGARRAPGIRLRANRVCGGCLLRCESGGRQSLRELSARVECGNRRAHLVFPVRSPRHLGSGCASAARSCHATARRPHGGCRRPDDEAWLCLRV